MKSFKHFFLVVIAMVFIISGCSVKTYTVVKDRPDQVMEGNQGYLMGGESDKISTQKKTRKTYVVEIEYGKREQIEEKDIVKEDPVEEEIIFEERIPDDYYIIEELPIIVEQEQPAEKITSYTVQKGDTLEKIAARPEVYGNKNKWYRIYKANKDTIKNPDRISPGQVIIIPQ